MDNLQAKIDVNIRIAVKPSGDPTSLRERDQAAAFLLDHAALAFPRLMKLFQEKSGSWEAPRLIELIGFFKLEESVPLLKDILLKGIPDMSRVAAKALGAMTMLRARQVLEEGFQSGIQEIRIAAIEGARISGDKSWCPIIESTLFDEDPNLRYYAVNAAAELGCLTASRLSALAEQDEDIHVRQLCASWLARISF